MYDNLMAMVQVDMMMRRQWLLPEPQSDRPAPVRPSRKRRAWFGRRR